MIAIVEHIRHVDLVPDHRILLVPRAFNLGPYFWRRRVEIIDQAM